MNNEYDASANWVPCQYCGCRSILNVKVVDGFDWFIVRCPIGCQSVGDADPHHASYLWRKYNTRRKF